MRQIGYGLRLRFNRAVLVTKVVDVKPPHICSREGIDVLVVTCHDI